MVEHRRLELLTSTLPGTSLHKLIIIVLICLFVLTFVQFALIKYYVNL